MGISKKESDAFDRGYALSVINTLSCVRDQKVINKIMSEFWATVEGPYILYRDYVFPVLADGDNFVFTVTEYFATYKDQHKIANIISWKGDRRHGLNTCYYKNGKIRLQVYEVENEREGECISR